MIAISPTKRVFEIHKYALAVAFAVAALVVSGILDEGIADAPFLFFIAAVALAAWRGGLGPGIFCAGISVLLADYFLIDPLYSFAATSRDYLQFVIFCGVAVLISWLENRNQAVTARLNERNTELRIILDAVTDGITVQDIYGHPIFANNSAADLLGYANAQTMVGLSADAIQRNLTMLDGDDRVIPWNELPRVNVFATGKPAALDFKLRSINNPDRWISLHTAPVFDSNGQVRLVVNVFRDVTKIQQTQELRNRLASLVQNSDDAIVSKQLDGTITSWNPAAEMLYGYSADKAIGQPISMLFPPEIKPKEMELLTLIQQGQRIDHYETKRLTKAGKMVDISLTISPIRNDDGDITGYSTIERDITDKKYNEDMMMQLTLTIENQRQRLNHLVANVPGVVYDSVIDPNSGDQKMNFISEFATEMFGYPPERWHANPNFWQEIVHTDDWDMAIKKAEEAFEKDKPGTAQFRCLCADGRTIWVDAYFRFEASEHQVKSYGVLMDVTARKQRAQQIEKLNKQIIAQQRRLHGIVVNVPGIVYEAEGKPGNGGQKLTYFSPYVEKMLGYTPQEVLSEQGTFSQIIHPDDLSRVRSEAAQIFEEETGGMIEFRCITKNDALKHVRSHITVVHGEHENPQGFVGVMMDVTDQKLAEEAIDAYMKELQRSNEELEQFAYVASHDLQEPLRKVTSYLQLIEQRYSDKLDDDAQDFIDFAVDGAARMKTLINDLLTYSRVQRNRGDFKSVDMQMVVDQVLSNLQLTIEDNDAQITTDNLPNIRANSRQMVQLFQNLISNAIKFRRDEIPKIHIGAEKTDRGWQFCVRDNGIGIEQEYMERIFVIFQRLHGRSKYPGTGIGLAICRKVIENHGGRVWLESEPGHGTTFYFTIDAPRERIALQNATD